MIKYLLLAIVIIWLFYSPTVRQYLKRTASSQKQAPNPSSTEEPQIMLTCAHCGVHFPKSDAVEVTQGGNTQHFCCADHMRAGPRQG